MRAGLLTRRILLGFVALYGVAFLLCAVAGAQISPYSPVEQHLELRFLPPLSPGHLLGTDDFGRDVLSRIMYGARPALLVGVIAVGIALAAGMLIGLVAGLAGGFVDSTLMLLMDSVLSFPTVLLAITMVAVLGYGVSQVMLAVGIIYSPVFARIVRAEALSLSAETYVIASRSLGTRGIRTVFLHIIPNMIPRLLVQGSATFALAVVIEASLSFLGLGTQPPEASWGLMLKDARTYLLQAPWLALFPGIAIGLTVFSFNYLGDILAEHFGIERTRGLAGSSAHLLAGRKR